MKYIFLCGDIVATSLLHQQFCADWFSNPNNVVENDVLHLNNKIINFYRFSHSLFEMLIYMGYPSFSLNGPNPK